MISIPVDFFKDNKIFYTVSPDSSVVHKRAMHHD